MTAIRSQSGAIYPKKVREERKIIMVVDGKIIEEITSKAVKNAIAEMEQVKPKTVLTTLGEFIPTSAEIDKDRTIDFYIKVDASEISYEWKDLIDKAIETGKLAHEEAKRYGWTWSNAGVDILPRLRVVINSDWKISTGLEVYYQDKELYILPMLQEIL